VVAPLGPVVVPVLVLVVLLVVVLGPLARAPCVVQG